jgi:hypothetical protein
MAVGVRHRLEFYVRAGDGVQILHKDDWFEIGLKRSGGLQL